MNSVYYLLSNVHVESFRAHAGAYVVGVPQPTSVAGLARALTMELARKTNPHIEPTAGVLYGVQSWFGLSGISLNQRQGSSVPGAKLTTPSAIDDRVRASAEMTFIFEVLVREGDTPSADEVKAALESLRLQGASLFVKGKVSQHESLHDCARRIPRDCFFLVDAVEDLAEALKEQPVTWQAMLSLIERPRDADVYKPRWVPAITGWRELRAPRAHSQMRAGAVTHALAEPVIGLAKFRSAASLRGELRSSNAESTRLLWKHACLDLGSTHYVAVGSAPFTPDEFNF